MAKATIKSETGAVITVEGSDTEVAAILGAYEKSAAVGKAKSEVVRRTKERKEGKKRESATDIVEELKEEGFFDKPKLLGEVAAALEERAIMIPVTTLSGVMLGLVKRRVLRRKKIEGKWAYGK